MNGTPRDRKTGIILLFLLLVILGCWVLTPRAIESIVGTDSAKQGQYGDLFGSINALFSGLALFGVIIALWLQSRELRVQHEEIVATQEQQKTALELQKKTVDALVAAMYARSFDKIYDVLDSKEVVTARHVIENDLRSIPFSQWEAKANWKEYERSIKTLLRAYNIAGIIVKNGYLPTEHIIPHWEPNIRSTWQVLKPYVYDQRKQRGSRNHWPNFEWLVEEAERFATELTPDKAPE
jgi:hypothetical protein